MRRRGYGKQRNPVCLPNYSNGTESGAWRGVVGRGGGGGCPPDYDYPLAFSTGSRRRLQAARQGGRGGRGREGERERGIERGRGGGPWKGLSRGFYRRTVESLASENRHAPSSWNPSRTATPLTIVAEAMEWDATPRHATLCSMASPTGQGRVTEETPLTGKSWKATRRRPDVLHSFSFFPFCQCRYQRLRRQTFRASPSPWLFASHCLPAERPCKYANGKKKSSNKHLKQKFGKIYFLFFLTSSIRTACACSFDNEIAAFSSSFESRCYSLRPAG